MKALLRQSLQVLCTRKKLELNLFLSSAVWKTRQSPYVEQAASSATPHKSTSKVAVTRASTAAVTYFERPNTSTGRWLGQVQREDAYSSRKHCCTRKRLPAYSGLICCTFRGTTRQVPVANGYQVCTYVPGQFWMSDSDSPPGNPAFQRIGTGYPGTRTTHDPV